MNAIKSTYNYKNISSDLLKRYTKVLNQSNIWYHALKNMLVWCELLARETKELNTIIEKIKNI